MTARSGSIDFFFNQGRGKATDHLLRTLRSLKICQASLGGVNCPKENLICRLPNIKLFRKIRISIFPVCHAYCLESRCRYPRLHAWWRPVEPGDYSALTVQVCQDFADIDLILSKNSSWFSYHLHLYLHRYSTLDYQYRGVSPQTDYQMHSH
jgi:hypothetical protein